MSATEIRDRFIATLDHIELTRSRLSNNSGPHGVFRQPDQHKLAEGLFLSAWTHWEQFLRELFIEDLATNKSSALSNEIKSFRTKRACYRLATLIVDHPDENRWVEWNEFDKIKKRADALLGSSHRYLSTAISLNEIEMLKRVRNAIAHKSDRAWDSFCRLVIQPPFSLTANQRKGITVGRFLTAHKWANLPVLEKSLKVFTANAHHLVP